MKKIFALVAVALLIAVASVPAFAQGRSETAPNCFQGISTALASPGALHRSANATAVLTANLAKCGNAPVVAPVVAGV